MADQSTENVLFVIDVAPADGAGGRIESLARTAMSAQERVLQMGRTVADDAGRSADAVAAKLESEYEAAARSAASVGTAARASADAVVSEYARASASIGELALAAEDSASGLAGSADKAGAALREALSFGEMSEEMLELLDDVESKLKSLGNVDAAWKGYEKLKDQVVELQGQSREYSKVAKEEFLKVAKGALETTKGLAQIGLISEESSEKLLRGLVAIEGGFNAVKGTFEGLVALSKMMDTVRALKESGNTLTAKSILLDEARVKVLQAEAVAASAAAGANGRLASARGAASAAGGSGAGSVVSGAAGSAAARGVGGVAAGAGGGFLASTVGGVGVGVAGMAAAVVGAITGVGLVLYELGEIATGAANKTDSLTNKIATWEVSVADWFAKLFGGEGWDQSEAQNKRRGEIAVDRQFSNRQGEIETDAARQIELSQQALIDKLSRSAASNVRPAVDVGAVGDQARLGLGPGFDGAEFRSAYSAALADAERIAQLQQQGAIEGAIFADAMAASAGYSAEVDNLVRRGLGEGGAYEDAMARGRSEVERALAAQEKQAAMAREVADIQIAASERVIQNLNTEIDKRRQSIREVEEATMSAAERFAALGDAEQQQAIAALERARSSGGADLTDEERSLLRSVGGKEAQTFARAADVQEARDKGFFDSFGAGPDGFDAMRSRLENEKSQLEARLEQQMEVKVVLQMDRDAIVSQFEGTLSEALQVQQELLSTSIQEATDRLSKENNDRWAEARANSRK